jgi:hypothetical protein
MNAEPAQKPLRMTAREFVQCLPVLAAGGLEKARARAPKKPRYAILRRAQWSLAPMDRRRSRPLAASRCRSSM